MDFYKYQAAGNDFVLATSLESRADISTDEVIRLCDRRYGIGADGLIILEGSMDYDFAMRFFNNDGSGGMMCGNGGRCIVDLAGRTGIPASGKDGSWVFEAPDGIHRGRIVTSEGNKSIVCLSMNDITSVEPVEMPETDGQDSKAWRMNTGTDHLVMFRDDLDSLDVLKEGRRWRYDSRFAPKGVNVNFVQYSGHEEAMRVRTYEKGVEYETLSCGTGIIASAVAAWMKGDRREKYTLRSTSDTFTVSFSHRCGIFQDVTIEGPAEQTFRCTPSTPN